MYCVCMVLCSLFLLFSSFFRKPSLPFGEKRTSYTLNNLHITQQTTTMSSYTLHTPPGNFRAFKILIAAEYNSIQLSVPEFDGAKAASISPSGKAPVLETPSGVIFESNSIARFISKLRRDTGLMGNGSLVEEANVDQWCDFAANKLELPACVWWYPVAGYMPFQEAA